MQFKLLGPDGRVHTSETPGKLGGYRPHKLYGRLDCPSALRHVARGHYIRHRVFFADEVDAIAAGYRPCAKCLPQRYKLWKTDKEAWSRTDARGEAPEA
jgi:hypothetical protein